MCSSFDTVIGLDLGALQDPAAMEQMQAMMQNPMVQEMLQDPQMLQSILQQVPK